jgi:hypothetical protein
MKFHTFYSSISSIIIYRTLLFVVENVVGCLISKSSIPESNSFKYFRKQQEILLTCIFTVLNKLFLLLLLSFFFHHEKTWRQFSRSHILTFSFLYRKQNKKLEIITLKKKIGELSKRSFDTANFNWVEKIKLFIFCQKFSEKWVKKRRKMRKQNRYLCHEWESRTLRVAYKILWHSYRNILSFVLQFSNNVHEKFRNNRSDVFLETELCFDYKLHNCKTLDFIHNVLFILQSNKGVK